MKIKQLGVLLREFATLYQSAGAMTEATQLRRMADALARHGSREAKDIPVIIASRNAANLEVQR